MKRVSLIFCILLSACATTKKIYVPVVTPCPIPALPPKLHYPVSQLKAGDSAPVVMKAWASSLTMCVGQNEIMRKKLEAMK